jgi:hypothetical protein
MPDDRYLSPHEVRTLIHEWEDAMHAQGFVKAWVDPATGRLAVTR